MNFIDAIKKYRTGTVYSRQGPISIEIGERAARYNPEDFVTYPECTLSANIELRFLDVEPDSEFRARQQLAHHLYQDIIADLYEKVVPHLYKNPQEASAAVFTLIDKMRLIERNDD